VDVVPLQVAQGDVQGKHVWPDGPAIALDGHEETQAPEESSWPVGHEEHKEGKPAAHVLHRGEHGTQLSGLVAGDAAVEPAGHDVKHVLL